MSVPKGVRVGGRQKGTPNKRTSAMKQAAAETVERVVGGIENPFDGDAHALLVAVYKDPANEWNLRLDAAKAAIRYEKPALAAIEHSGDMTLATVSQLTPAARKARIAELEAKRDRSGGS